MLAPGQCGKQGGYTFAGKVESLGPYFSTGMVIADLCYDAEIAAFIQIQM